MRRGYVFSLLVALMLGFFMLISYYYLVERPQPEIHRGFMSSREMVAYSVVGDLADEIDVGVVRGGGKINISESSPHSDGYNQLNRWQSFLAIYQDSAKHNASMDLTNVTNIDDKLWLVGKGVEYYSMERNFTLNHSGGNFTLNDTVADVSNSNCPLDGSGDVETRIIVNNLDSGVKYTSYGSDYSCFLNFTNTTNMTITIYNDSSVFVDYTHAPNNYTQRVSFVDVGKMYVAFDKYNTSSPISSTWHETFSGTKKYFSLAGMNFVVADNESDGNYDYVFVDVDGDEWFNSTTDRWYLGEGAVSLGGKVFYMRFDLAGNWMVLYNVPGVGSLGSWKGVWV